MPPLKSSFPGSPRPDGGRGLGRLDPSLAGRLTSGSLTCTLHGSLAPASPSERPRPSPAGLNTNSRRCNLRNPRPIEGHDPGGVVPPSRGCGCRAAPVPCHPCRGGPGFGPTLSVGCTYGYSGGSPAGWGVEFDHPMQATFECARRELWNRVRPRRTCWPGKNAYKVQPLTKHSESVPCPGGIRYLLELGSAIVPVAPIGIPPSGSAAVAVSPTSVLLRQRNVFGGTPTTAGGSPARRRLDLTHRSGGIARRQSPRRDGEGSDRDGGDPLLNCVDTDKRMPVLVLEFL